MVAEPGESGGGNGMGLGHPPGLNPRAKPLVSKKPEDPSEPIDTSGSVPPPSTPPPAPKPPVAQPPAQAPAQPVQPMPQPPDAPAQPTPQQPQAPAQPVQPAPQATPVQPPAPPVPQPITPMPPPPGWYGDIYGSPPRWWDGTVWTEHILIPLPSAQPAAVADEAELNFFDNAVISFSLAPDWVKFLTAAVVAAVIALAAFTFIGDDSSDGDVPDGFVPQTPEFDDGTLPGDGEVPAPLPDDGIPR